MSCRFFQSTSYVSNIKLSKQAGLDVFEVMIPRAMAVDHFFNRTYVENFVSRILDGIMIFKRLPFARSSMSSLFLRM